MIKTHWYVITGAPSSGKTTLINMLKAAGYAVAEEVARQLIAQMMQVKHVTTIKRGTAPIQEEILKKKIMREEQLDATQLIFFDRGIPDSIAYYQFFNLNPKLAFDACAKRRYRGVFFLEGLPVVADGLRQENNQTAAILGDKILKAYKALDYEPVIIPAVSVEKRLALILNNWEKSKIIQF